MLMSAMQAIERRIGTGVLKVSDATVTYAGR